MNSLEISKKIYNILSNSELLTEKVGDKIFPLIAEADTDFPFVVFRRNGITPIYTKDWLTEERVTVDIVCASNKYFESVEVAQIVRYLIEGYHDNSVRQTRLTYITEDFTNDCYAQRMTFEFSTNA